MESELGSLRGVSQLRRRYIDVLDAPNLPWRPPQGSSSDESFLMFLPPLRGGVWSRQTLNPSTIKDRHPTDEEYLQMAKAERYSASTCIMSIMEANEALRFYILLMRAILLVILAFRRIKKHWTVLTMFGIRSFLLSGQSLVHAES